MTSREQLLHDLGYFYGANRFAICWTKTNAARHPGDSAPKQIIGKGWQHTTPLPDGPFGAAMFAHRGQTRNPAINLRTSNLIGVEADGAGDLERIKMFALPATLTEMCSRPDRLHGYFRPPAELESLPKVSFRFENGAVTGASNNYYLCAPAIHPSGVVYAHVDGLGPIDVEIATLTVEQYQRLLAAARAHDRVAPAAEGPIGAGHRHEHLRRISFAMRRAGAGEAAITAALIRENQERCDPPKDEQLVRALATYTADHVAPRGSRP